MKSLKNTILEQLGNNTQSGVMDLSEPAFVETEMRAVTNGYKAHLYFTIFFNLMFAAQLWSNLLKYPETHGRFSILIPVLGVAICLYFYKTWVDKKRKIALLKLLLDVHKNNEHVENWFEENNNALKGWFLRTNYLKLESLREIALIPSNKLLFIIVQSSLFVLFLIQSTEGFLPFVLVTTLYLLLIPFLFIDWRLSKLYVSLKTIAVAYND